KFTPSGSLVYSTYLGGSNADEGYRIVVDDSGSAYVTGATLSKDFPTTAGAPQATSGGAIDVFVAKLDPSGASLDYPTYLGGSGEDQGNRIAVDDSGNAYVTGSSTSPDFPTTAGAYQTTSPGAGTHVFMTELDPSGAPVYSTYLGGSGGEIGYGIAVDGSGNA